MTMTTDQYYGLSKLEKWYKKQSHQIIEISGVVGTGTWDLLQMFLDKFGFDPREVIYLSYNQKKVLELAYKKYHAYYLNGFLYRYSRKVDYDTLPILNPNSSVMEYEWKKKPIKKVWPDYKLIVVLDSLLVPMETLTDLSSLGLPIILVRDPMLIPDQLSTLYMKDPNIELNEVAPEYIKNPLVYFSHLVLNNKKIEYGNYDNISVVPKKQMNLFNLKSSDMVIAMSDELRDKTNMIYRTKILKQKTYYTINNERIIIMNNMYKHKLVNADEKKIKVYLARGVVGNINRINKHALNTRYVPFEFKAEFYHEIFDDLYLDRFYLNDLDLQSRQIIPDEFVQAEYAYALTPQLARLSHWDKVTLLTDNTLEVDYDIYKRLLYTAMTRATQNLTIIL
jgi:hypothetical protein